VSGFGGEVCTGFAPVESNWPASPLLTPEAVLFVDSQVGVCFTRFSSRLLRYAGGRVSEAELALPLVELAADGNRLFALVSEGPTPESVNEDAGPGCSNARPCEIESIGVPTFRGRRFVPRRLYP
jgi:hypothetical protein